MNRIQLFPKHPRVVVASWPGCQSLRHELSAEEGRAGRREVRRTTTT